jgi:hypothetical protein
LKQGLESFALKLTMTLKLSLNSKLLENSHTHQISIINLDKKIIRDCNRFHSFLYVGKETFLYLKFNIFLMLRQKYEHYVSQFNSLYKYDFFKNGFFFNFSWVSFFLEIVYLSYDLLYLENCISWGEEIKVFVLSN